MQRWTFFLVRAAIMGSMALSAAAPQAATPDPLRVMVHASFDLPKPLLAQFESESGVRLSIIKGGDAGEMLNKLILTRARPIADLVFGIDNTMLPKAMAADVLEPYAGASMQRASLAPLAAGLVPVDYGYVTLNYDRAWFSSKAMALPRTLEELTLPAYRNLLVVQNPATSSPGFAFMLATVAGLGEESAFDWWGRMRANGLKVAKGWSEAYYTDFSRNGGTRPLVVSYASSPAAEVFYSKQPITEAPTASLFLRGGVFRQVEGIAMIKGTPRREAAARFIEFMRSPPVQQALQTSMWMFAVEPGTPRQPVLRHAVEPAGFDNPTHEAVADRGADWLARWTRVVLK
ncbi:MAG: thiamine ABC transporter substrate binding subunit [Burkholderiaceae bacterium]